MRRKEESRGKRELTGIILSALFTLTVPIGSVFLMGLLLENFLVLYFYTKQIFLALVVLVIMGICMIIYQIMHCIKDDKTDPKEGERKARRERRQQRRANAEGIMKHGVVSEQIRGFCIYRRPFPYMIVDTRTSLLISMLIRKKGLRIEKEIGVRVIRMGRRVRHGERMSSYKEAVMDLMIRMEESERYPQRYGNSNHAVIVEENGEEEHNPSFAIGKKEREETVQNTESIQQEEEGDTEDIERYKRTEVITIKLTI